MLLPQIFVFIPPIHQLLMMTRHRRQYIWQRVCKNILHVLPLLPNSQPRIWQAHWWCHGSQGKTNSFWFQLRNNFEVPNQFFSGVNSPTGSKLGLATETGKAICIYIHEGVSWDWRWYGYLLQSRLDLSRCCEEIFFTKKRNLPYGCSGLLVLLSSSFLNCWPLL